MTNMRAMITALTFAALLVAATMTVPVPVSGQGAGGRGQGRGQAPGGAPGQAGQGRGQAPAVNLPAQPTAVALPTMSAEVSGPGPMFESSPSLWPGRDRAHYKYETREYWVSGTANGQPYRTRLVVRKPSSSASFSGLVLFEPMHPSGAAHMYEYTSIYTMSSGHAAVEVVVHPQAVAQFTALNAARYADFQLANGQANEILAQVGALVRKPQGGPLAGLSVRKMVMAGTSATAGTLIAYLPAHMVYRTPEMQRIFDGFMPTSNGTNITQMVDVPVIHVPTMNEVRNLGITTRQDGDEGTNQYRVYEFPGMVHIDTRDNVRLKPNPCQQPLIEFPLQAYMAVALHHLFQWTDKGIAPPKAERIWVTRSQGNVAVDQHGNALGGIRNPYVDVPIAAYIANNTPANPPIANPSPLFQPLLCGLGGYQLAFSRDKLRQLYKNKQTYVRMFEQSLSKSEAAGWSLPVYREILLADAAKVSF